MCAGGSESGSNAIWSSCFNHLIVRGSRRHGAVRSISHASRNLHGITYIQVNRCTDRRAYIFLIAACYIGLPVLKCSFFVFASTCTLTQTLRLLGMLPSPFELQEKTTHLNDVTQAFDADSHMCQFTVLKLLTLKADILLGKP